MKTWETFYSNENVVKVFDDFQKETGLKINFFMLVHYENGKNTYLIDVDDDVYLDFNSKFFLYRIANGGGVYEEYRTKKKIQNGKNNERSWNN